MAKVPSIEQTFYYAVPPEKVFSALTEPAELAKWFVERAEFNPKKGGSFRLTWPGGYSMRGKVKLIDPPKKLHLLWVDRFEGGKVFETEARFTFTKRGKGTQLTLSHRGFKSGKKWVALYGGIQSGWAYYLTNLRSVLEHMTDLRSDRDALG
ncbi:MAG TPA: SRPBCC domain-containing protein [Thermoplasmata archaeon]|nr:SRPBCC domain-containing protein [Thermoplasmata archaeon]